MTQTAELTASDGAAWDCFGNAVAVSSGTVIVGATDAAIDGNSGQGAAYVFQEPASGWASMTQTAKLIASDGAAESCFGNSVSASGSTVVVGAPGEMVGSNSNQGAAYIFQEPASGWASMTQTAKLTASDGTTNAAFGSAVANNDGTVVVGSLLATVGTNTGQGAAYVFTIPGTGWANMTQTAKLTASDGTAGDNFGSSLSIYGTAIVVGANNATLDARNDRGTAYLFAGTGAAWTQAAKLTAPDGASGDHFGSAVSVARAQRPDLPMSRSMVTSSKVPSITSPGLWPL